MTHHSRKSLIERLRLAGLVTPKLDKSIFKRAKPLTNEVVKNIDEKTAVEQTRNSVMSSQEHGKKSTSSKEGLKPATIKENDRKDSDSILPFKNQKTVHFEEDSVDGGPPDLGINTDFGGISCLCCTRSTSE